MRLFQREDRGIVKHPEARCLIPFTLFIDSHLDHHVGPQISCNLRVFRYPLHAFAMSFFSSPPPVVGNPMKILNESWQKDLARTGQSFKRKQTYINHPLQSSQCSDHDNTHRQAIPEPRETDLGVDAAHGPTEALAWSSFCVKLADHDIGGV